MKKTLIGIIFLVVLIFAMAFFIPIKEEKNIEQLLNIHYDISGNEANLNYETNNPVVALYIKNYGSVVIELYPEIAPNTVKNFISLIKKGFYDNNTFHRLMTGFVLQGGDPTGTGSGGPGYSIVGEFNSNGYENNLSHQKWTVSMARGNNSFDTAGSQFFICLGDASYLDGNYAAFGKVIDGFDIIEKIEKEELVSDAKSGKLVRNLVLKKALVDLKGKTYLEPEIIKK